MRGIDRDSHFSFQNSVHIIIIQTHWKNYPSNFNVDLTSIWISHQTKFERDSVTYLFNFSSYIYVKRLDKKQGLLYTVISFWTLHDSKMSFWQKTYLQSLLLNSSLIGLRSGMQGNRLQWVKWFTSNAYITRSYPCGIPNVRDILIK